MCPLRLVRRHRRFSARFTTNKRDADGPGFFVCVPNDRFRRCSSRCRPAFEPDDRTYVFCVLLLDWKNELRSARKLFCDIGQTDLFGEWQLNRTWLEGHATRVFLHVLIAIFDRHRNELSIFQIDFFILPQCGVWSGENRFSRWHGFDNTNDTDWTQRQRQYCHAIRKNAVRVSI